MRPATLIQDLRYGMRTLAANPAFAATAVLTLAVTLALTIGAFTVFNAYVLRPYAVRDPAGLHVVAWHARDGGGQAVAWSDYEAIRTRSDLFTDVFAASTRYVSSQGRPLAAELVSEGYFDGLGVVFHLGRPLGRGDQSGAGNNSAVLGYQAWERLFARDPAAIGRTVDINGHSFTVVGVLGPRFAGLHAMPRDIWLPVTAYANLFAPELIAARQAPVFTVSIRLRPGVTALQAQSAVTPLLQDAGNTERQMRAELRSQVRPVTLSLGLMALLSPVFAAFALTLLAGCANVSNAMLARAMTRRQEIAIRIAAGASPGRVIRQLLTEGVLIALLATAIAMPLVAWGLRVATTIFLASLPPSLAAILRTAPLEIDGRVWLFAVVAAVVSTLAFALVPALQAARPTPMSMLGAPGGSDRRGSRLRALLVAGQVAISLLLAVPALTLARNGVAMRDIEVGFEVDGVTSIHVREGDVVDRVRRLAEVMAADPRFADVAVTSGNPLFGPSRTVSLESQGHVATTPLMFVSSEYFATLRIAVVAGRVFRSDESAGAASVAIVSAATASTFWPGQDPIGQTLAVSSPGRVGAPRVRAQVTVIGVAGDIIGGTIVEGPEAGRIYLPTGPGQPDAIALLVRANAARDLAPEALQTVLQRVAADPELFEALPLADVRALQVYPFIAASWIGSLLGALAAALSISGLVGVLTYTLTQRTRELGIRIALGATARGIVTMVLWQTARLTGIGALAGLAGAFAAMKLLAAMVRFNGVSWLDGVAFAAGLAVVAVAAGLAACYPASRAARIDPARILRVDG
jgi:predicted permease